MNQRTIGIVGVIVCITPALVLSVLTAGCGSSATTLVTVPVSGVVMLDGVPLPAAVVTFHDPEGKVNPCSGVTDSQGKFKLGFGSYDGAMPGKYKVTIEHLTKPDGSPLESQPGMDAMQLKLQGLAVQSLPAIYSDLSQTQLVAVVEKGSPKPTNFDLTKKGA